MRRGFALRRGGLIVFVLVAVFVVTQKEVRASHCGSYVIANPENADGKLSAKSHVGDPLAPRVPSPCERGQCRSGPALPFSPPSTVPVRPVEHLLFEIALEVDNDRNQSPALYSIAARARAGFYAPLEHPPDAGC